MCYATADAQILDAAYEPQVAKCSGGLSTNTNLFSSDSILWDPDVTEPLSLPNTTVKMILGGADNSSAVPQGETWYENVTPPVQPAGGECAPGAGHEIPDNQDGAQQIASDIIGACVAPANASALRRDEK